MINLERLGRYKISIAQILDFMSFFCGLVYWLSYNSYLIEVFE